MGTVHTSLTRMGCARRASALLAAILLAGALAACSSAGSGPSPDAGSRAEPTTSQGQSAQGQSTPDQSSRGAGHEGASESGDAAAPSGGASTEGKEGVPVSSPMVTMRVGDATLQMALSDTAAARELAEHLKGGPVTLSLRDYGGFEKVGPLPWGLATSDERITTVPGDVVLYQGNQISVFYDGNAWSYTMLGHVDGATRESMLDVLGSGDPTVELSLS